ncbi:Arc family DNA-binding protein [Pseudooceanicola atlanticus]|uniref:Arc-like DNA binding domain-containing protein n=1 Tax=Pseudooceanicola atlanticus TaxID=1461694 RepID=A0A0A0EJV2_9RHOB|nr:Arc family DNA-binding protein [Pseudooceanicola atlanticus]KGM50659.1 hypothetical protein ATO9_04085 [Pseudooceanicola atlanticus]
MTDDSSQKPTVQIALRLSPDLRDRIKGAAQSNNRSVNSELIAVLEEKYPAPRRLSAVAQDLLETIRAYEKKTGVRFYDAVGPEKAEELKVQLKTLVALMDTKLEEIDRENTPPTT